MSSGPAALARPLRRALTIVVGAVLVVLAWTSAASADDARAENTDGAQSRGLIGAVAGVLDDTTSTVEDLVAGRDPARRAERGTNDGDDRRPAQESVRSQADAAPAPREASPAAATGASAAPSSEPGAAERPRRVIERVTAPIAEVTDPVLDAARPLTEPTAEQVERVVAPVREGLRPVTRELRPVLEPVGDLLEPVERTLSPVGDLLESVTVVLRPVGDLVDDVALPTPIVPSEPSTVVPDDGSGPVRPIPASTEAPAVQGVKHVERGSSEYAATTTSAGAPAVSMSSSAPDVAVTPSPAEDRIPAPAIPAAASGSGASPTGAGSGGPSIAALSDAWTPAAPLALDRPVGRSTTLLTVAAERPGFAPD